MSSWSPGMLLGDEMNCISESTTFAFSGLIKTSSAPQLTKKSLSSFITLPVTPRMKAVQPLSRS
eukprot:CAMPEP_0173301740 /NCGR_PEP_ID=MMETSP1143-20121109/17958_1 /TAXON_ID=483371 /ORGANISM="non described non described, Strain CCMP2298" /LENGTH=63 /DNA_ID=CAMNT_0014242285 /DNA_START=662 /DNA_END=853 /DNA_ORIENTATION=+